jgi:hypothetical protein
MKSGMISLGLALHMDVLSKPVPSLLKKNKGIYLSRYKKRLGELSGSSGL